MRQQLANQTTPSSHRLITTAGLPAQVPAGANPSVAEVFARGRKRAIVAYRRAQATNQVLQP